MLMFKARGTQWLSLAAMAMAAAAAITLILIGSPGRSAPSSSAPVAHASVGKTALGHDASSEPRYNRGSRPTVSDKVSGQPALILYILMEAARHSVTFSR
jgi:hypothetical protein